MTRPVVQGTHGGHIRQRLSGGGRVYQVMGDIRSADPTTGIVHMQIALEADGRELLVASVNLRDGKTMVLGSAQPEGSRDAIFLVVRPTLQPAVRE